MNTKSTSQLTFVTDADQLRDVLGDVSTRASTKVRTELNEIDRSWLAASPFCLIATSDEDGSCDVSPKGDPPGFALVLDEKTLVIPERRGNRRADGFHNILQNGKAGLIFLVPGRGDTLRINGRANILKDAPFFDDMVVKGHRPSLGLLIEVDEVFFHCSKAFLRSELWDTETWEPEKVPSRPHIAKALENTEASIEDLEVYYGEQYKKGLYGKSD